jgi:hypothetical protein
MTERKIESLGNWSNEACLHAVLEQVKPDDSLLVITMPSDGSDVDFWNANVTFGNAVFMLEAIKYRLFKRAEKGEL